MQNAQDSASDATPGGGEGGDKAGGVVQDAKNAVVEAAQGIKARAAGAMDEGKGTAAQTLGTVAAALRGAAQDLQQGEVEALGTYAEGAAEQLDKVAGYLREKDLKGLTGDAETFARRHPEVFLGGAFLAGILAARFLKSSRPKATETTEGGFGSGFAGAQTEPFNPPHFESTGGQ
jgi:hypothetical protein